MAFTVNEIKSNLKFGGARPTLFKVTLGSPFDLNLTSITPFFIQASTLPGSSITPIEVPYFGRKIRVAGDRTFEPWSVTVMNDEDFAVRHAMETWHNKINSLAGNLNTTGSSQPTNYKVQAYIEQFSKAGQVIRKYQFQGMFPTEISAIDVNWADTDTIEMFQVTFMYDYYEISEGPGAVGL